MFRFLRIGRSWIKTCGLSYETPLLFSSSSLLFLKRRPFLRAPWHLPFPHPHLRTRERTRPCASRTQRVRNSCLHPSPSLAIRWFSVFCAWRKCPFFAFTGEGNKGEAFTRKSLFHRFLPSYGEEVKAKNEKQRTRALRVRVGGWGGRQVHFRKRSFGSWHITPNVGRALQHSMLLQMNGRISSQRGELELYLMFLMLWVVQCWQILEGKVLKQKVFNLRYLLIKLRTCLTNTRLLLLIAIRIILLWMSC